jgi:hypothetical protein
MSTLANGVHLDGPVSQTDNLGSEAALKRYEALVEVAGCVISRMDLQSCSATSLNA